MIPLHDSKGWTVVLLYPDYMQDGGLETFVEHSRRHLLTSAVADIGTRAAKACGLDNADDFAVIACMRGNVGVYRP